MKKHLFVLYPKVLSFALGLLVTGGVAFAGSATWSITGNGDWNVAGNWSPATIPNAATDTATFNGAFVHSISLSATTQVNGIVFGSAATISNTITTSPGLTFVISGLGITNNAGVVENFATTVSGAFSSLIRFSNSASAGAQTSFTANGGAAIGFDGGTTQFNDASSAGYGVFIAKGGTISGAGGGIVEFHNSSTAANGSFTTNGGSVVSANGAITRFFDSSDGGFATFVNNGGLASGTSGGTTQFNDTSSAGIGIFTNSGNSFSVGSTRFGGNSTADGGAFINNNGGYTLFADSSTAGLATFITNDTPSGVTRSTTQFTNTSTAGGGTFLANGGTTNGANGGATQFFDTSTAGTATFNAYGGTVSGAGGGLTQFNGSSSAGNGILTAYAGTVSGAIAGITEFNSSSTAGSSAITNLPSAFYDQPGGLTQFNHTSTAGMATIVNASTTADFGNGGKTQFLGSATAGSSAITNQGAAGGGFWEYRGITEFGGSSDAGNALITNLPALTYGGNGGMTYFHDNASAGTATIVNSGNGVAFTNQVYNAIAYFADNSSASTATITNQGGTAYGATSGFTRFYGTTADNATIINEAGTEGGYGGRTEFYNDEVNGNVASAGNATIINRAPTVPNTLGGRTTFFGGSAGTSTITAEGGSVAGESSIDFYGNSTAASSTLTASGSTGVGGGAGVVDFDVDATAGNATITAESGTVAGAPGGRIYFFGTSDGGNARAIVKSGATFDISPHVVAPMSIGSIEGDGSFLLGNKRLTVGGNGLSTAVSGTIADGGFAGGTGGALTKVGAGTLTLSGANTYTGLSIIADGTLAVDGSLLGGVVVNSGGTLQGTGSIAGNVNVAAGGILAPGNSPGTLSVGSLALNSGSQLKIELGGSIMGVEYDSLTAAGAANLGGTLDVSLIDLGSGIFVPEVGDEFTVIEASGGVSGTFATTLLPALRGGLIWEVVYAPNEVDLSVGGVLGDYNLNGIVDAADYVVWRKGLGTTYTQDDYNVWRANFGATAGIGSGSARNLPSQSAVPEPASAMVLLLGLVIVRFRCYGHSSR